MKKILKNKKGFTLVEIIVVLVIMAILAGAGIPALLGFIDDAKGKTNVAEARAAYVAAQSIVSQGYAEAANATDAAKVTASQTDVEKLAGVTATTITVTAADGKVSEVKFVKNGKTVTITGTGAATIK